jgi:hypothetical protein
MLRTIAPKANLQKPLLGFVVLFATALRALGADQTVYNDSLQNGWANWSWATVNLNNAAPVHGGSASIGVSSTNWQALYLHHPAQNGSAFTHLTFWINGGGTGGQSVQVQAQRNEVSQTAVALAPLPVNSWRQEIIPLTSLGVATATDFDGVWWQVQNSGLAPTFYVDDIALVVSNSVPGTSGPVAITVNAALNQRPINPLIYGVAFAASNQLAELNSPLNRSGGNSETRYNWQLNAHNHAADWYFESIPDSPATPAAAADGHVAHSKNGGAQPMLTIPMLGWMPKLTPSRSYLASYAITKYGPQFSHDTSYSAWYDFGDGIGTNTVTQKSWLITTNDPTDANFPTNSTYQQAFVQYLTNRWGLSTNGGIRYYCLDNEHTLWHSTHRDVHPVGTTMQEIRDRMFDYGTKVKAVDPNALLVAPEEWGWPGYLYSGYDWQWAGAHNDYTPSHFPDRSTNGGWDYGPWLLNQCRLYEQTNGVRLLDVFTYHIYPQGANEGGNDTSTSTQLGRNRSTRALWDPTYIDQSWIGNIINLIPRMKGWVATYYPGTKIGITEYNWGAENHINGATAQADILGIFGREGLDLATRWTTPSASTPTDKAIKMYRNYDGNKSTFGDTSVSASGPNPDNIATFAALRSSDGALTVMAINKQLSSNAPVNITLTNFLSLGTAQVWRLTSANTITRLSDLAFAGNDFSHTLPAQSITLFVIRTGPPPNLRDATLASASSFSFRLDGVAGRRYAIQASSNFVNWIPLQTNLLTSNSLPLTLSATNSHRFFRAQWVP